MGKAYKECFRQLSIFGVIILVGMIIANGIASTMVINRPWFGGYEEIYFDKTVLIYVFIMSAVGTLIITTKGFSFLNKRSESDMYHSFPISRTKLFTSVVLASLTWIAISIIPVAGFFLMYHSQGMNGKELLGIFILWVVSCVYECSVFSMALSSTGNKFLGLSVGMILFFVPRCLINITKSMYGEYFNLFDSTFDYSKNIFGNQFCVWENLVDICSGGFYGMKYVLCGLAFSIPVAILFLFLGAKVFKARKSEIAGAPEVFKPVKIIAMVLLVLLPSITIAWIPGNPVFEDNTERIQYILFLFAMGTILFFAYGVNWNFTKKKFVKILKFYPAFFIAILMNFGIVSLVTNNVRKQTVDVDKTQYVLINGVESYSGNMISVKFDRYTDLETLRLYDKEIIRILSEGNSKINKESDYVALAVGVNNGKGTCRKTVYLDIEYLEALVKRLAELDQVQVPVWTPIWGVSDRELQEEIQSALAEDFADKNIGDYIIISNVNKFYTDERVIEEENGVYYLDFELESYYHSVSANSYLRLRIDETLPKTFELLRNR